MPLSLIRPRRRKSRSGPGIIAALDIGTSKVTCLIGRPADQPPAAAQPGSGRTGCRAARGNGAGAPGGVEIIGVGFQVARGIQAGAITDMTAAMDSIAAAVEDAEVMSGETIRRVYVGVSGPKLSSRLYTVGAEVQHDSVGLDDIRRALLRTHQHAESEHDEDIIHSVPVGFAIDGVHGIQDPIGLYGEKLDIRFHLVTADPAHLQNLMACLWRCHLEVEEIVSTALTSGISCLIEDEKALGVALLDIGAGGTTIGLFRNGQFVHGDHLPIGGLHITNDLARGLQTPVFHAERIKIAHADVSLPAVDEDTRVPVHQFGDRFDSCSDAVEKPLINRIARARAEEILEAAHAKLKAKGFGDTADHHIVLVGGASRQNGLRKLAEQVFERPVKIGSPRNLVLSQGPAEDDDAQAAEFGHEQAIAADPANAAAAGILLYGLARARGSSSLSGLSTGIALTDLEPDAGLLRRLGRWIRDGL
jgi:cell division protein FtsA